MTNPPLIFRFVLLLLSSTSLHSQPLTKDFIEVKIIKETYGFEVNLNNRAAFDITVRLEMKLHNMQASVTLPFTTSLRGNEHRKCFELHLVDTDQQGGYESAYKYTFGNLNAVHDTVYVYSLPYKKGAGHKISQGYFGNFSHNKFSHYAVDFEMVKGTEVYAAREGVVVGAYELSGKGGSHENFMKFTNYIFIRHSDLTIGAYYHLKQHGVLVRIGQKVERGQFIGFSGQTGFTVGPHLHFEVFRASSGRTQESVPLKFDTLDGIVRSPVEGRNYIAR